MNMRRFFIFLGIIGLGVLFATNLNALEHFIDDLAQVHWYLIPLIIIIQLASYYSNARFYDAFFALSGHHVPIWRLIKVSLAINFTNQVIPAGGVAGTTYLSRSLADVVPPGKSTLSQLGRYIFTVISNVPLLAFGMIVIFFSGSIRHISVRLVLLIVMLILTAGIAAISYFSERSRMRRVASPLIRGYNRVGRFFFRHHFKPLTAVEVGEFFDEFYSGYREIMRKKRSWVGLFTWAAAGTLAEMATIYATFIGFGYWPNIGVVILAYQIAIVASLIGPFTAGAGALEFGMVGGFTALGVPFALSFAVVIVYRFLNMILFLPPGFYFYRKDLAT